MSVMIDGVEYVRADSVQSMAKIDDMPYVIVRTFSAGVHAGFLKRREGKEVELLQTRRIWYWTGAASLSQLAGEGSSDPSNCKFPAPIESIVLTEAIEILPCTERAMKNIMEVAIWKQ
jgi:hypothetical protein